MNTLLPVSHSQCDIGIGIQRNDIYAPVQGVNSDIQFMELALDHPPIVKHVRVFGRSERQIPQDESCFLSFKYFLDILPHKCIIGTTYRSSPYSLQAQSYREWIAVL